MNEQVYPTLEQVNAANYEQICRWWRCLPLPGESAVGTEKAFSEVHEAERKIQARIAARLNELCGFAKAESPTAGSTKGDA